MPSSSRRTKFPTPLESPWHGWLTRAVDIGIASTVLVAPLFMGGRGPVGRFVFVLCIAITAVFWCARQCVGSQAAWRKSGVEWLLLAGLGVLLFQLMPLPQSWLSMISPKIAELLPAWTPTSDSVLRLGVWNQLSLHPLATQSGRATYVGYAVLFLVTVQRLNDRRDVQRLLQLIAVATCMIAGVGLAQFLFGNGKFLWVFEHVSRDTTYPVKGPFQNQNHFAHLLALGIGPLLWWLAFLQIERPKRHRRRHTKNAAAQTQALWLAIGIVTFAALLTFSRGGVVAMLLAAGTGVAILAWKQMFSRRSLAVVMAIAGLMVVSLAIHGYEPLARKLGTLRDSQSIDELSHARWALWNAHFEAIPEFWLVGTGVGTHSSIYPAYLAEQFDANFTHGESGYVQLALETGLLGSGLFLIGLGIAFRWAIVPLLRSTDRGTIACAAAILPGLLASVVHSFGDFVWYIPACMTTTVLLLAAACRLYQTSLPTESSNESDNRHSQTPSLVLPRIAWIGASVVCLLTFVSAANTLLPPAIAAPHWYAFQRLERKNRVNISELPASEDLASYAALVEGALAANPRAAHMQTRLAEIYLQRFELEQQHSQNPMPLSQIRDAAFASQFTSKQAQDEWLDRAVGENRHLFDEALRLARLGINLNPLQGDAYALLAQVSFLEGPEPNRKRGYVEQALRVRPFDSRVQFVAGNEAALAGNADEAMAHWKKAFHGDGEIQAALVHQLAAQLPAKELLDALAPDQRGIESLLNHYRKLGETEHQKTVAAYYTHYLAEKLQSDPDLDKQWALERLSTLHEQLDSPEQALQLATAASRLAPADFDLRMRLSRLLIAASQFPEAQLELQWCIRRQPNHKEVLKLLATANRGAILQQANASSQRPLRN